MNTVDFLIIILSIVVINYVFHHLSINDFRKKTFPKQTDYFVPDESIKLPIIEHEKEIPKIIHKCHKDKKSLKNYEEVFQQTEKLNPDYDLVYHTDEDIEKFIRDNYSERIYNAYKCINPIYGPAKSDLFRYLLIYLQGGIYMDVKSGPVKNLDPLLKNLKGKLSLSHWTDIPIGYIPIHHIDELHHSCLFRSPYGEFQNWHIISGKGNPILRRVIIQVVTNIEKGMKEKELYNQGKNSVIYMSGPIMYTHTIEKYATEKETIVLGKNCNGFLKYNIVDHVKIEKMNHYRKIENKYVLK